MNCYLFSRRDWPGLGRLEPVALSTHVFFQMWRTRANPYNKIAERDVVYIGDPDERRLLWEVRVSCLLSDFHYGSSRHALSALRTAYGLYSEDLNNYHRTRSGAGWLLAWSPTVMRSLDLPMPAGVRFGQNGYRELSNADLVSLGVPASQGKIAFGCSTAVV